MFLDKRTCGRLALAMVIAAAGFVAAGIASAQDFPNKSIRLLTPYPPGGSTDAAARVIAPKLSEILGQQVLVEAMPGANGAVAMSHLANAPADGYTILVTTASPIATNPHTFPNVPYNPTEDFIGVSTVARTETAIVVHPSVEADSLEELIELAQSQDVKFGLAGLGGQPQLILEKIKLDTGARFVMIPYAGGGPAVTDTIAGHVDAVLNDVAPLIPLVEGKRVKGTVVLTDAEESVFLPSVETLAGKEEYSNYVARSWLILLAPDGTPPEIAEQLRSALAETVTDEAVVSGFRNVGLIPFISDSSEEATQFIADEFNHFKAIADETGVRVE